MIRARSWCSSPSGLPVTTMSRLFMAMIGDCALLKVLTESVGIGESLQSAWALAECVGIVE